LVTNSANELKVTFLYARIQYAPDQFLARYNFQDFYDAGFDTLLIEANTDDGKYGSHKFAIKDLLQKTTINNGATPTPLPRTAPSLVKQKTPQTAIVISVNANLRQVASVDGEVVQALPEGSVVDIIKQSGPWFLVKYNGQQGWLHGNTIQIVKN
jgi:uncharacterized protein YgiM (DUF1202 family)